MNKIVEILIERDGITEDQASAMLMDAQIRVHEGEDPEEILWEDFSLEPDYIDFLI